MARTMTSSDLRQFLPSTAELPCSDDVPVDNEEQNLLPNLLMFSLLRLWADRLDWFFGVDMAIYHTTGINVRVPVVPECFLSLGVERRQRGKSRWSYATWENDDIPPVFALEMVSHIPRGEYDVDMDTYAKLGVLYYVIYNREFWQRDGHQPFEVYKLEAGTYRLQIGEPFWMPEVGLGIGRHRGKVGGLNREILAWYDGQGNRYLSEAEQVRLRAEQARSRAEQAEALVQQNRLRMERLEELLRSQGIDPNDFA